MFESRLGKLKYTILPGRPTPGTMIADLHDKAYSYWKQFWHDVFAQTGVIQQVKYKNEFSQMDLVVMLTCDDQIVGLHLYRFFDLGLLSHRDRDYFQSGAVFVEALQSRGIHKVMPMEYLTVDAGWRKRQIGVSLGSVLVSLGTRVQRAVGMGASTGICRQDVGVDAMLIDSGGIEMGNRQNLLNTPVAFIGIPTAQIKDVDDAKARALVEKLWRQRIDYSLMTGTDEQIRAAS